MARKSSAPVICQNRAVSPVAPGAYRRYALVYDLVWGAAPYDRFVDLCLEAAAAQGTGVRRVLVAACGTGSAAVELAGRGYEVTAFDLSLEMLAVAAAKRWPGGPEGPGGSPPRLVAGDLRAVPLGDGWADLVLVLNASINYLLEPAEVVAALAHLGRTAAPGGTVVVEEVFTLPGIGRLVLWSIYQRDYPLTQSTILFIALLFMTINLAVDLLYGYLDPRIRYGR